MSINENISKVLIPRRLEGRRELYIKKLKAMLQQKHIEGDVDLRDFPEEIEDLGNVETISGYLNLYNNQSITSLGNLTSVGGYLNLGFSKVASLGNLASVGGYLSLYDSKVASLGKLISVGGDLYLYDSKVNSLGNLTSVGGTLYLYNSKVNSLGNLKKVGKLIYIKDGQFSEELLAIYKRLFPGKFKILKTGNWEILK